MANSNRSGKSDVAKRQPQDKAASDLVYVKMPDKKIVKTKKSLPAESPDLNDAHLKAESKRRIRAINPTDETW